jgi:hypothetical protein
MDRVFRLWKATRSERERHKYLFRLWELCRPEIKLALNNMAEEECSDRHSWLERRGLDFDEVCNAVFPAVKDAAGRFDAEHRSGAHFSTFAMGYIRGEVARIARNSPPHASSLPGSLASHPRTTMDVVHTSLEASQAGSLLVGTRSLDGHDDHAISSSMSWSRRSSTLWMYPRRRAHSR